MNRRVIGFPRITVTSGLKYGLFAVLLLALVFPFLEMLATSLKTPNDVVDGVYWPARPAIENFVKVFEVAPLATFFLNSIVIATGATLLNLAVSIPAAFALSRLRFPGQTTILLLILVTQMFARIVLLLAAFRLFHQLDLLDSYTGLIAIDAAVTVGFSVWFLAGYFSTIPREMQEAAALDGCGPLRTLWFLMIPLARPGITAAAVFAFIAAWNEFLFALTFISDPDKRPLSVGIYSFIGRYQVDWNYLMAASLLATIPVLVMFLAVQRNLISGLVAGTSR
jgi:multiple sugar transport system permease protein